MKIPDQVLDLWHLQGILRTGSLSVESEQFPHMLSSVRVERFKSLVSLELELGRINVLIGANGSGKSNILEAVGVLGAAAFGRVDDETLLRRGVRPGVPRLYKSAFPMSPAQNVPHIRFEARSACGASYHVTLWNPLKHPSPAWRFKTERLQRTDQDVVVTRTTMVPGKRNQEQGLAALETVRLEQGDSALALMDELRNYNIYCPNTPCLRGMVPDMQPREPVGLAGGRLPEAVNELLNAARKSSSLEQILEEVLELIDWARGFTAGLSVNVPLSSSAARSRTVIRFVDRFMAKDRDVLTGYDASEGALYILFCAALALLPGAPGCLAVDNIDQALNPRMAMRLMAALCSWTARTHSQRQWLVTAHNPAVLDGLPLDDPEVRLLAVDRDSNGHTVVKRVDLEMALKARPNAEWTLSRMWMAGLLGAVPNV